MMTNSAGALKLYESLASSAWDWLGIARRLRLGFSEDTISDLTALEIAQHTSDVAAVRRVSKHKERFVGFDWLWVIRRSGGRHAIYVVQAKKMRIDQSKAYRYGRLKYPSTPPYQIDALEEFAKHIDAVPLYCFYNNVEDTPIRPYWNCKLDRPRPPQMGCTLVPISVARLVHNGRVRNNFYEIHHRPEAIPWRCLFHRECTTFDLYSISERPLEKNAEHQARARGADVAEFLTESEDGTTLDFDEFVSRFDLDEIVGRYINKGGFRKGGFRALMERTVSIRWDE